MRRKTGQKIVVAERDEERIIVTRGKKNDNRPYVVMHYRGVGSKKRKRAIKS